MLTDNSPQPRIFVAGHRGMVGSAIVRRLQALGWQASISLEDGLRDAYGWYVENVEQARTR